MPMPLATKELPEILLFPIVVSLIISVIISLIPLWMFANFATSASSANFLCKEQSCGREPVQFLDYSVLFDELGDHIIRRGGHHGVFVRHVLQENSRLVIRYGPAQEIEGVLLLTQLGDWYFGVHVRSIRVSGRWTIVQILILDVPSNLRWVVIDPSEVMYVDTPKIIPTLDDVELQLWLLGQCQLFAKRLRILDDRVFRLNPRHHGQ
jgi:hypothetical protein